MTKDVCSLSRDQPDRDVRVALSGAGGGVELYGGLVQVRLDAVPLGLDPVVEVARGAVEGVVVVVAQVVATAEASDGVALLRQSYYKYNRATMCRLAHPVG